LVLVVRPVKRVAKAVSYPGPRDVWGAQPLDRNIKYARMYDFEQKHSKISFPEGPQENV